MKSFNEWMKEKVVSENIPPIEPEEKVQWPPTRPRMSRDEIMKMHAMELNLDVRNRNTLMKMGIDTIGQIIDNLDKVFSNPFIDREELEVALKAFGLI